MNKKKLVISLLIVVMVLSLALTALVGCDKKEDTTLDLTTALETVLDNTVEDHLINNLAASAGITVSTTYGGTEKALRVKFNGDIALDTSDDNETAISFAIEDAKANANIVNFAYIESLEYKTGYIYLVIGEGENQQKFIMNAMSVKETLKMFPRFTKDANNKDIPVMGDDGKQLDCGLNDDDAQDISDAVTSALGGVSTVLDMIKDLGVLKQEANNDLTFSLSLSKVLSELSDMLSIIDDYTDYLGVAVNSGNLASILPELSINLTFKLNGAQKNNVDNATLTGMSASIGVNSKDIKISRTNGKDFVEVNVAKDFKLGLALDFKFGEDVTEYPSYYGDEAFWTGVSPINALNFTVEGQLVINKELNVDTKIGGTFAIQINVPKDTYNLKLAVDVNPFKLIDVLKDGLNFETTDGIIAGVKSILNAVDGLAIEIVPQHPVTLELNGQTNTLKIYLKRTSAGLQAKATEAGLLGNLAGTVTGLLSSWLPVDKAIDGLLDAFGGSASSSAVISQTSAEDFDQKTKDTLDTVKAILDNLTILVNQAGNSSVVDVDVKDIVLVKNYKTKKDENGKEVQKVENGKPVYEKDKDGNDDLTKPVYEQVFYKNTTLDAKLDLTKTNLVIEAVLKGIVIDGYDCGDLNAVITADKNGISIAVKDNSLKLDSGKLELDIDLEIKITNFTLGNAKTALPA